MRVVETKVYEYHELSDKAKEKAREWAYEVACNFQWWDSTYEDAKNIGLKITSFDLDRNRHAKGEFLIDWHACAQKIVSEHGPNCETHKTAKKYIEKSQFLGFESENPDYEDQMTELEEEFLKELLQDYAIMLQHESDDMASEEYLREMIEANSYTFTEEGKRFG